MKKSERMKNTKTYHYYNANPKGLYTGDCRYRAYALATGISWEKVVLTIALWTVKTGLVDAGSDHIDEMLQEFGNWVKQGEPKKKDGTKYTVGELAKKLKQYPDPVIVKVNHHITCIKDGKVWDTWDCSNEYVRNYWMKGA